MLRLVWFVLLVTTLGLGSAGCQHLGADASRGTDAQTRESIAAAATGDHRSEQNIARNAARHPVETLSFFGLRSDMTVVEVLPGGLWYTEILAPVLRDEGQLVAAGYDPDLPDQPAYRMRGHQNMLDRFAEQEDVFGTVEIAKLTAPVSIDLGLPASADMVLTFRSTHGWVRSEGAQAAYSAFFEVLKPGGVLGVVQHRAGPETDTTKFNGYVPQETVIALALDAGFVLEAKSEINANPRDRANYSGGVWTLPPSLSGDEAEQDAYVAIGESDRMTLRFRKPQ